MKCGLWFKVRMWFVWRFCRWLSEVVFLFRLWMWMMWMSPAWCCRCWVWCAGTCSPLFKWWIVVKSSWFIWGLCADMCLRMTLVRRPVFFCFVFFGGFRCWLWWGVVSKCMWCLSALWPMLIFTACSRKMWTLNWVVCWVIFCKSIFILVLSMFGWLCMVVMWCENGGFLWDDDVVIYLYKVVVF